MARGSRWGMWVVMLCLGSVPGYAAGERAGAKALGFVTGQASVAVNAQPLASGAALFAGDVVRTGVSSMAVVELRAGASARLEADGEAVVEGGRRLALRRGALTVRTAAGERTWVRVLGAEVEVRGEGGYPALCTLAAVGRGAAVLNTRGAVEIRGAGAVRRLALGEMARLEAGPQATEQRAGHVSAAIPAETVQRAAQPKPLPLKVQDAVAWQDLVRTEKTGRVRIQLEDGSFLNIGANSQMRIARHDPESQQTEVELTVGRLRGEVVKLTKPGAKLEVKTQTAVIGVVGTIFVVLATPTYTRVWCLEGQVAVQGLGAVATKIELNAGETTTVPKTLPPTAPARAPVGQLVNEVSATSAGESMAQSVGQALGTLGATPAQISSAATTTVVTATHLATTTATTAAGAASAAMGGVAVSRADAAHSTLVSSVSSLETATSAANAATSASDAAIAASNAAAAASSDTASAISIITQQVVSPSQPCGCQ